MKIETVGVIGAGTLGNGIAQVFAVAGFPVGMQDLSGAAPERAMATIRAAPRPGARVPAGAPERRDPAGDLLPGPPEKRGADRRPAAVQAGNGWRRPRSR
jgi:hypothetical protein